MKCFHSSSFSDDFFLILCSLSQCQDLLGDLAQCTWNQGVAGRGFPSPHKKLGGQEETVMSFRVGADGHRATAES